MFHSFTMAVYCDTDLQFGNIFYVLGKSLVVVYKRVYVWWTVQTTPDRQNLEDLNSDLIPIDL